MIRILFNAGMEKKKKEITAYRLIPRLNWNGAAGVFYYFFRDCSECEISAHIEDTLFDVSAQAGDFNDVVSYSACRCMLLSHIKVTFIQSIIYFFKRLLQLRKWKINWIVLCHSKPGAAGLRGFPVLPRSRRISLYCSSLRQWSWRPESYPVWEKTEERWRDLTQQSTNSFITSLTGHLLAIFSSNTPYLLASACSDLSFVYSFNAFACGWECLVQHDLILNSIWVLIGWAFV